MGVEVDFIREDAAWANTTVAKERSVAAVVQPLVKRFSRGQKKAGGSCSQSLFCSNPTVELPPAPFTF
jgi:hypothetical protein